MNEFEKNKKSKRRRRSVKWEEVAILFYMGALLIWLAVATYRNFGTAPAVTPGISTVAKATVECYSRDA